LEGGNFMLYFNVSLAVLWIIVAPIVTWLLGRHTGKQIHDSEMEKIHEYYVNKYLDGGSI